MRSMLTIRPTKMLAKRLGFTAGSTEASAAHRAADWCAHEFRVSRYRYLMFCNTVSLFPVVTEARGVTDDDTLAKRLVATLRLNLEVGPYASIYGRWIAPSVMDVQWAEVPNRSVLGAMNELIFAATLGLEDGLSPVELSPWLARTPLSPLGMCSPEVEFSKLG